MLTSDEFLSVSRTILDRFSCDIAARSLDREQTHGRPPAQILRDAIQAKRWFLANEISEERMAAVRESTEAYIDAIPDLDIETANEVEENAWWAMIHSVEAIRNLLNSTDSIGCAVHVTKRTFSSAECRGEETQEDEWMRSHLRRLQQSQHTL